MPNKDLKLSRGDVVTCELFAYAFRHFDRESNSPMEVDARKEKSRLATKTMDEESRVRAAASTGTAPPKEEKIDIVLYDESRGVAEFVVEETGHYCEGHTDTYCLRRLRDDGTYDPEGEIIEVRHSSAQSREHVVLPYVKSIRKMRIMFV